MSWTRQDEYEYMQTYLMMLKYFYYEKSESIVTDQHFDSAEKYTKDLQEELGIEEDEKLPTNMVGFDKTSEYWGRAKNKYKRFIK